MIKYLKYCIWLSIIVVLAIGFLWSNTYIMDEDVKQRYNVFIIVLMIYPLHQMFKSIDSIVDDKK